MADDLESRMADAVATGDPLEMLMTMRTMLAERFDRAAPRDTASIARQLERTIGLIAELRGGGDTIADDKIASFLSEEWTAE